MESTATTKSQAGNAWRRCWLVCALVAMLLSACGGSDNAPPGRVDETGSVLSVESLDAAPDPTRMDVGIKELQLPAENRLDPPLITLPPLDETKAQQLRQNVADPFQPLQVGVARAVAQTAAAAQVAQLLQWSQEADGSRVAALGVRSPGAQALRLGLQVQQLAPGALLRLYGRDGPALEISAEQVLTSIDANRQASAAEDEARLYWLPTLAGDTGILEIRLAAGLDPDAVALALPQLSHLNAWAVDVRDLLGASASCNVDAMCAPGNETKQRAVAHLQFVDGGNTYLCTGTLLNNTQFDYVPYFLTARHCISSQLVASTLETHWNYRASRCNAGDIAAEYQRLLGGARLLWTRTASDTALLQLNTEPPAGAVYAGWNAQSPSELGDAVFGIHHPAGDAQKFSTGQKIGHRRCSTSDTDGSFSCAPGDEATSDFVDVMWFRGTTEGGSSGSALFSDRGHVIGQLYGGNASCANPQGSNIYGRFDQAFDAGMQRWLAPGF